MSVYEAEIAALMKERADLNELLAVDPASRTGRNYDRRDNLDRRIDRARANSRRDPDGEGGAPAGAAQAATGAVCGRSAHREGAALANVRRAA